MGEGLVRTGCTIHSAGIKVANGTGDDVVTRRCAGGVKLYTPDGKIAVDNTLNARLQVVLAQVRNGLL